MAFRVDFFMDHKDGRKKESIEDILSDLNGLLNRMPSILEGIRMPEIKPMEFRKPEPPVLSVEQPVRAAAPPAPAAPEAAADAAVPEPPPVPETPVEPVRGELVPQSLGDFMFGEAEPERKLQTSGLSKLSGAPLEPPAPRERLPFPKAETVSVPRPDPAPAKTPEAVMTELNSGADLPPPSPAESATPPEPGPPDAGSSAAPENAPEFALPQDEAAFPGLNGGADLTPPAPVEGAIPSEPETQTGGLVPAPDNQPEAALLPQAGESIPGFGDGTDIPPARPEGIAPETAASGPVAAPESGPEAQLPQAGAAIPGFNCDKDLLSPSQDESAAPAKPEPPAAGPVLAPENEPEAALLPLAGAPAPRPEPVFAVTHDFGVPDIDDLMQLSSGEPDGELSPVPEPVEDSPAARGTAEPTAEEVADFSRMIKAAEPEGETMDKKPDKEPIEENIKPDSGGAVPGPVPESGLNPAAGEISPAWPAPGVELSVSPMSAPRADGNLPSKPADASPVPVPGQGGDAQHGPSGDELLAVPPPDAVPGPAHEDKTVIYTPGAAPSPVSNLKAGDLEDLGRKPVPEGIPPERVRPVMFLYAPDDKAFCATVLAELDAICLKSVSKPMFLKRAILKECELEINANYVHQLATDSGAVGVVCLGDVPQEKVYEVENVISSSGGFFRHYDLQSFSHSAALDLVADLLLR